MTIAVTGASGQLGRLAVEALLRREAGPIVAIVRDPAKVTDLAARGVEVRRADYDDVASLDAALVGVRRLLLVSGSEPGKRIPQHTNVIRAAERAGVELLAYTSIPRATQTPMLLAAEHRGTEEVLAGSSVPYVLLRNGWYWENYLRGLAPALQAGVLYGASGDGRVAGAARADYAEAAAVVLSTDGHAGAVYELGGDERLTLTELAGVISAVSGTAVRYQDVSAADYAEALEKAGIPGGFAQILADSETGASNGWLDVTSGDLHTLNGRPSTPVADVFRAALAG
ncbi:SDR family oxidoreductase [Nocardia sp. alder85J]|uniref:SDR family oxidoreductase n=1 Tax=Nocardia sp. alder85J TaxID=2862949 RepID=UPI001CD2DA90|nr:SDR family oxidoreductase [Nocardia sp. alder85J]MCX4098878.1 SDR family oxidoreductase [Nocardia sp. alder85J]